MPLGDSLRDWDYTRNLFARITPEENKLLMRAFSGSPPALIFKAMGWNGREDLVVATEHSRWWENGGYFFLGAFEAGRIASLETKRGSINAAPILEALKSGRDEKLMDALVKYVSYYAHSLCDFWLPELIDKILLRYPEAIPEAYGGVMGREHDDAPEMFAYLNERFPLPRATRIRMVGNLEIPCEQEKLLRAFLPPDMSEEEYHALGASILGAIREGGDVDAEHDGETGCNLWGDLPYPGGDTELPVFLWLAKRANNTRDFLLEFFEGEERLFPSMDPYLELLPEEDMQRVISMFKEREESQ